MIQAAYLTFKPVSIRRVVEKLFRFMTLLPLNAGEPMPLNLADPSTDSARTEGERGTSNGSELVVRCFSEHMAPFMEPSNIQSFRVDASPHLSACL